MVEMTKEQIEKMIRNIDKIVDFIDKQGEAMGACVCKKCDYRWIPRLANKKPVKCPECQSKKWNIEN